MSDISTHSILAENIAAKWHQHAQANDHRSQGMKLPETKTKTETSRPKTSQSIKVHSERKKECEKVSSSKTSKECYRLGYGGGGRYGRGRGWDGCVGGRYGSGGRRGSSDGGGGWGDDGRRGGGYGGGRGGGGSGRGGGGRGGGSGCRRASGGGGGGGFRKR